MKVCVYTLGCRLNQCESEALADAFAKEGFDITDEEAGDAGLYVVNTCTVTAKAEQKARRMIRLFAKSGASVVVTGCYAQMAQSELEALGRIHVVPLERKSALLSLPRHIKDCAAAGMSLEESLPMFTGPESSVFDYQASSFSYHSRAYLKVQDGCDNSCGYCRVHIARGPSQSLDADEVIRRALDLEGAGFNEIVLTGVNLTMYDHEGAGLGGMMLRLIPRLKPSTRLRLSSMEPDHIDEALIEAVSSPAVHPHFHLPLQSASQRVLERCGRLYPMSHVEWVVKQLRAARKDPFIACDLISGLPGEGEAEFQETVDFIRGNDFAQAHVFPFSPRPGTALEKARDRVSERVRDERAQVLRELSEDLHQRYIKRQVGSEVEVLLESRKDGVWQGTTGNYLKVKVEGVEGLVLDRGQIVRGILKAPGLVSLS